MTTWAEAAAQMIAVVGKLASLQGELAEWTAGRVNGGPSLNGNYPFTQPDGTVVLIPCPAKLQILHGDPSAAIAQLAAAVAALNLTRSSVFETLAYEGVTLVLSDNGRLLNTLTDAAVKFDLFETIEPITFLILSPNGRQVAAVGQSAAAAAAVDISNLVAGGSFETLDPVDMLILSPNGKLIGAIGEPAALPPAPIDTSAFVEGALFETLEPARMMILSPGGREVIRLAEEEVSEALSISSFETVDDAQLLVLTSFGRLISRIGGGGSDAAAATAKEVADARGSRLTLAQRIDTGLTAYGDPIGPTYGAWLLQETRLRLRQLLLGESAQLVICILGDSYSQNVSRWVGPFAQTLIAEYGLAGVGWLGFPWLTAPFTGTWSAGNQPVNMDRGACFGNQVTICQLIGAWDCTYRQTVDAVPSLGLVTSSTAGAYARWNFPAGHNAAELFYGGDGTGVIRVSWDDGATYSADIALTTTGGGSVLLPGLPATAATARLRVMSGNVALAGVDMRSNAPGIRVQKIASSGSHSQHWSSMPAAGWSAAIGKLAPHLSILLFGTNDQPWFDGNGFANQLATVVGNIRAARPACDILLSTPPENQRTNNVRPMAELASAQRRLAVQSACAHLDLQYYFGSPANYAFAYAAANPERPWFNADLIHPEPATGGRVIADAYLRLATQSI